MRKPPLFMLTGLLLLLVVQPVLSQPGNVNLAMSIAQARKKNASMVQQYSWNCRIEYIENGSVKDVRIDSVTYGPDGNLQRSLLNDQSSPMPRGFLRRAIAEDKRKQTEQFLFGLRDMLDQYTLPTAGKILDFVNQATVNSEQSPSGAPILQLNGTSVVSPGDTLALTVNPANMQTKRMQITTTYEGLTVNATASFKTLQNGLTYMAFGEVDVPASGIVLQVHNYDYQSND